ncbi:MAG: response regulator transcription factor [Alkalinema sp. RL_2_19]|nr:response regulator transcription factor [Alkalinema sp. RL_2_19]
MSLGKILVVEDEDLIRETVELALQEEGFEVKTIGDGRAALEMLQTADQQSNMDFVLIILDLMLPNINGLDICRLLRRQNNLVPILMLSAKGTETDRVVGLEVGADDYLTKPFGMRELIARCRALLRRHQQFRDQQASDHLSFSGIALYPQECRVTISGDEINLSPKEFKLLELFMSHPKRVWSREQLLEKVWGHDFIGDSKTVDVHIRWLREKLEQDPSHPKYLVTIRGFGYRFG